MGIFAQVPSPTLRYSKRPHTRMKAFGGRTWGWLLDNEATIERVGDRSNAAELAAQPFYRFLEKTYMWHIAASALGLYLLGGLPFLLWGFCVRTVWVYHITWAVNSVAHCWGKQVYNTGDLSRNNLPVGILAFGEGWHNNHHAFEFSARHGLEWWQVDMTWYLIWGLKKVGFGDQGQVADAKAVGYAHRAIHRLSQNEEISTRTRTHTHTHTNTQSLMERVGERKKERERSRVLQLNVT